MHSMDVKTDDRYDWQKRHIHWKIGILQLYVPEENNNTFQGKFNWSESICQM